MDKDDERLYFREEDSEGWRHRQNECYGSEYILYAPIWGMLKNIPQCIIFVLVNFLSVIAKENILIQGNPVQKCIVGIY